MNGMFKHAESFNQPLNFNTENATNISGMSQEQSYLTSH